LTGAGEAARLPTADVTSSVFSVLEVNPAMGRAFLPEEAKHGSNRVVLLSDKIWRNRLGADANILGKAITLDGIAYSVVGVMPADFAFPHEAAFWLPLEVGGDPGNFRFGDNWEHSIVLDKHLPAEPNTTYPICTDGQRACPPEDCGGVPGFYELLDTLANPRHRRHKELRSWIGDEFNPETFSIDKVNRQLSLARRRNKKSAR
jgi:hypothetical protein